MEFIKANWPLFAITLYFAYKQIKAYRFKKTLPLLKQQGALMIDVRSESEFASGHASGSINIPLQTLTQGSKDLPKDQNIIVCCASGMRSSMAKKILMKNGFKKIYNAGSWTSLNQ